jgi:hypothetical protein
MLKAERSFMTRVLLDFPHAPGGHCGSTAMRDMLRFFGHELTEDMVFGLGAGIDFMYINNPGMDPPVYIGGRAPELEVFLCERLGVGMELVSGLSPAEAWLSVKEMIDQGVPAMVHADVFYLDYLRAKRHFAAHRIVLVGYDDEKGVAYVADNDREDIQECGLESLARARSSESLPRAADNAFYRFDVPAALTPPGEAIPPAVAEAVRHNIGLAENAAAFEFGQARIGLGVVGLREFASDIGGFGSAMSPGELSAVCKNIYVSAEKGGTGYGGNFRRMYGRFLEEASRVEGFEALAGPAGEFVAIGDMWTELSLMFKENSGEGEAAIALASPLALEISEREARAFASLEIAMGGSGD